MMAWWKIIIFMFVSQVFNHLHVRMS